MISAGRLGRLGWSDRSNGRIGRWTGSTDLMVQWPSGRDVTVETTGRVGRVGPKEGIFLFLVRKEGIFLFWSISF